MKILSLDSSATVASVALFECDQSCGKLLSEFTVNNGNTHSETLLPMVETVLKTYGITPKEIDVFAATTGPGSFTGVRIGAATIKGLAFGTDKPCVEVSTLEAIAENLCVRDGLICPVMNARRSQVYTALFRAENGKLFRLMEDSAISIEELDGILSAYNEPVSLAGDGYDITASGLKLTEVLPTPERLRHQSAASVASVACRQLTNGSAVSDKELKVTYLRPSQAERTRLEKENLK